VTATAARPVSQPEPIASQPPAFRPLAIPSRRPAFVRSILRNPSALIGLLLVLLTAVGAAGAPWLAPHDPTAQHLEERLRGPSSGYVLGTDALGRDQLSRLLWGARASIGTAAIVMVLVLTVAVALGTLSGYFGGWLDQVLMRLADMLMAFPGLILAIAIAGMLGPGLVNIVIALAAVSWVGYARVVRGMALSVRERDYVLAARTLGASHTRTMLRHLLPNLAGPIVVLATIDMGRVILSMSGLSFLGLGAQPPMPEWGAMLNDGRPYLQLAPAMMIYPGIAIAITVLGFNLLGDGLRDALDPQGATSSRTG
jgi:ABC-type dipeptide/oligopeptide/nickel transport system permease subunit